MSTPLMPKSTAVWLIENTSLTFDQIAVFCGLHALEVRSLADGDAGIQILGLDPIVSGQLTLEEIERCEANSERNLVMKTPVTPDSILGKKRSKYTPLSKRQDRPDAIAWLIKYYPQLSDTQISRLLGTTKPTIQAIRHKTHWNSTNIKPRDPVHIGLCSQAEWDALIKTLHA